MTKLQRITGKIFGETATATGADPEIGQFGSALAGTYVGTTDVATIQNLPAWSNGFIDSVTPSTQFPPLPEMTGFGKVLSYQNAYLLQQGIAEWDSATTYYENNFCSKAGKIYVSLTDANLNNDPENDTVNWQPYEQDLSNYANKDLSNLSATGKAKVVTLAHELDVANMIQVSTTLSTTTQNYTCPDDGIIFGVVVAENATAVALRVELNLNSLVMHNETVAHGYTLLHRDILPVIKGQEVIYKIYATGGSNSQGNFNFIPYKKA